MLSLLLDICSLAFIICRASATDVNELFFDDSGAWLMLRKILIGVDNKFGVGYDFTVRYQMVNIGTQTATNITITDTWDWTYFKPINVETTSDLIIFNHESLAVDDTFTFEYKLRPLLTIKRYFPSRANISYCVLNDILYVPDTPDEDDIEEGEESTEQEQGEQEEASVPGAEDEEEDIEESSIFGSLMTVVHGESSNYIISQSYLKLYKQTNYLSQSDNIYSYTVDSNVGQLQKTLENSQEFYHLQILSSSIYARSIGTKIFYWFLFVLFCGASVLYPMCMFDRYRGHIVNDIPIFQFYDVGQNYVTPWIKKINLQLVPYLKKQWHQQTAANDKNKK